MPTKYINTIRLATISTEEILPITVEIEDLPDEATNALVSAERFDLDDATVAAVDIAAKVTISTKTATVTDIWLDAETEVKGRYRIRIIAKSLSGATQIEANLIIHVLAS